MNPRRKVVRTDAELELPLVDARLRAAGHELVLLPGGAGEDELVREVREAGLLLMCYTPIPARVIESAPKLKGIVKYGVGIDAIDIEAAKAKRVPVVNVPAYAEETVTEGAFALLIALARKMKPIQRAMERKGWIWPSQEWMGTDLGGKTLGLAGVGHIGRGMARLAQGFRMRVLGYDPYVADMPAERRSDLRGMLGESDFVSVHCVLNDETRGLVGEAELRAMKSSAFLINVSRGAIVDEAALLAALHEKRIAGAALDVYGREPLSMTGHPLSALYAMDNVILFPHLTFYTREAMQRLEQETIERCLEILDGRPVLVKSRDPRLRAQKQGVRFVD